MMGIPNQVLAIPCFTLTMMRLLTKSKRVHRYLMLSLLMWKLQDYMMQLRYENMPLFLMTTKRSSHFPRLCERFMILPQMQLSLMACGRVGSLQLVSGEGQQPRRLIFLSMILAKMQQTRGRSSFFLPSLRENSTTQFLMSSLMEFSFLDLLGLMGRIFIFESSLIQKVNSKNESLLVWTASFVRVQLRFLYSLQSSSSSIYGIVCFFYWGMGNSRVVSEILQLLGWLVRYCTLKNWVSPVILLALVHQLFPQSSVVSWMFECSRRLWCVWWGQVLLSSSLSDKSEVYGQGSSTLGALGYWSEPNILGRLAGTLDWELRLFWGTGFQMELESGGVQNSSVQFIYLIINKLPSIGQQIIFACIGFYKRVVSICWAAWG